MLCCLGSLNASARSVIDAAPFLEAASQVPIACAQSFNVRSGSSGTRLERWEPMARSTDLNEVLEVVVGRHLQLNFVWFSRLLTRFCDN